MALDDVSAVGLLREAAILVVTVFIAARVISALLRLVDETETGSVEQQRAYRRGCPRRRPREAQEPSDGLPEIHRGSSGGRSAKLRGTSPMAPPVPI